MEKVSPPLIHLHAGADVIVRAKFLDRDVSGTSLEAPASVACVASRAQCFGADNSNSAAAPALAFAAARSVSNSRRKRGKQRQRVIARRGHLSFLGVGILFGAV